MNILEKIKEINQRKQDMAKSILEFEEVEMRYNEALRNSQVYRKEYLNLKMEYDRIYNVYKYDQPYYRNYFQDQSKILLWLSKSKAEKTKGILIFCFYVSLLVLSSTFWGFYKEIITSQILVILWCILFVIFIWFLAPYFFVSTVGQNEINKSKQ